MWFGFLILLAIIFFLMMSLSIFVSKVDLHSKSVEGFGLGFWGSIKIWGQNASPNLSSVS